MCVKIVKKCQTMSCGGTSEAGNPQKRDNLEYRERRALVEVADIKSSQRRVLNSDATVVSTTRYYYYRHCDDYNYANLPYIQNAPDAQITSSPEKLQTTT
jgi:hypothetical protein